MIVIAKMIIPLITLFVIIYGLYKRVDIYQEFLNGVTEGLKLSMQIFPSMFAMIVAVTVLVKSNIINDISSYINISFFPKEIIPIAILRPISSSSSLMILNNILKTFGVDSVIGKIASVITGSTDTTIYIIGLYYASVGVKKIKHSLFVGLLADMMCVIISILIVKIM